MLGNEQFEVVLQQAGCLSLAFVVLTFESGVKSSLCIVSWRLLGFLLNSKMFNLPLPLFSRLLKLPPSQTLSTVYGKLRKNARNRDPSSDGSMLGIRIQGFFIFLLSNDVKEIQLLNSKKRIFGLILRLTFG